MAIKGMTNRQAQFPEIGQLRKGGEKQIRKRKDGTEYTIWGNDLDHFRFTSEIPEAVSAFEAVYDGQPRMINVLLPFQYVDENWEAWQEEYVAGGLVHRCDGETMVLWQKADGSYSHEPKPCPYAGGKQRTKQNPGCKPTARLKVIVPELRRLAYVTVLTNSVHDICNLDSQLRALESLRHDLRGIPLQLLRSSKTISTPDEKTGNRVRRQKWLLSIEAAPQWVGLQLAAQEVAALPQLPEGMALLGNGVVDGVTGEIIEAEWDHEIFDENDEQEQESPPPTPSPSPTNGNTRPLDPEKVRAFIRKKAGWQDGHRLMDGEPIDTKEVPRVATVMGELFPNLDNKMRQKARHDVLRYLIGVDSTKALTMAEALAITDWSRDQDSAQIEAARILEAIAIEAGQQELPL